MVILITCKLSIELVDERTLGVVERLNKYSRTISPGINIIVPFIERVKAIVPLSDISYGLDMQSVITSDNVVIEIDAVVFLRITDAYKVTYNVDNYKVALKQKIMCNLRTVCGSMTLNALLSKRETICRSALEECQDFVQYWGIKLIEIHLRDIVPDKEAKSNMLKLLEAARQKNASIMHSEGEMMASKNIAEADVLKLRAVLEVLNNDPKLVMLYEYTKCIKALSNTTNNTIVIPMDFKSIGTLDYLVPEIRDNKQKKENDKKPAGNDQKPQKQ